MYLVSGVELGLDPIEAAFDPAILTHFMAKNWPKAGLAAPNWWISVDRGWIKSRHIGGDVLGPFPGSGMAIGGRQRTSKWPKLAINGPFVAISRPGGSKLVDQGG